MRLANKITLVVVTAMTLVVGASSAASILEQRGQLVEDARIDNAIAARTLADGVAAAYRHGGEAAARDLVDVVDRSNPDISFAWFTPAGEIAGRLVPGPEWIDRVPTVVSQADVHVDDRQLGTVSVIDSLEDDHQILRRRVERVLITTLLMAVVGATAAVALSRRYVDGPVRALRAKANRIGRGDFSGPLSLRGRDELSDLGTAMNTLAEQIATAQRQLQDESDARLETLEQLRHAERLATVGKLAAGIAHELGTPLNIVDGRAAMIETDLGVPAAARDFACRIREQTARMAGVIRQLLGFARRQPGVPQRVDLRELLARVCDFVQPLARRRRVGVTSTSPAGLWLFGDPGQLEQVFTNIVVNAIQASDEHTEVRIRAGIDDAPIPADVAERPEGFVRIEVEDHGSGISPEHVSRVFEPFFTTKEIGQGTGLGLSIAYGIVRDHGGWIVARPGVASGTLFEVHLPLQELT